MVKAAIIGCGKIAQAYSGVSGASGGKPGWFL